MTTHIGDQSIDTDTEVSISMWFSSCSVQYSVVDQRVAIASKCKRPDIADTTGQIGVEFTGHPLAFSVSGGFPMGSKMTIVVNLAEEVGFAIATFDSSCQDRKEAGHRDLSLIV
jgi:hypothetical protein